MLTGRLLLDFDGVLSPLVADPGAARLDPACAASLAPGGPLDGWQLAVVSGRSCDDLLPRLAPLEPDAVVGDHGLEIRLKGGRTWTHPQALRLRSRVLRAARELGGRLEAKRLTARAYVNRPMPTPPPGVRFLAGRGGIDVVPDLDWDKGRACTWLLDAWEEVGPAIYMGDEATDETAFRVLRPRGVLTVRVAPQGPTAAERTLPSQAQVAGFLQRLAEHLEG